MKNAKTNGNSVQKPIEKGYHNQEVLYDKYKNKYDQK